MTAMRLQRALARAGVTSRRKAEDLIRAGRVRVDGAVAQLGSSVDPARQRISLDGRPVRLAPLTWLALNKPIGFVVSRADPRGRARRGSRGDAGRGPAAHRAPPGGGVGPESRVAAPRRVRSGAAGPTRRGVAPAPDAARSGGHRATQWTCVIAR